MEMTKQRKMLLGLIGASLFALAVDKLFIGPPESASADAGVSETAQDIAAAAGSPTAGPGLPGIGGGGVPAAAEAESDEGAPASLPSFASLSERIVQAQTRQTTTPHEDAEADPFSVPEDWTAPVRAEQEPESLEQTAEPEPEDDSDALEQQFRERYRLTGTMEAVLDGQEQWMASVAGGRYRGHALQVGSRVKLDFASPNAQPGAEPAEVFFELVEVGRRFAIWRCDRPGKPALRVQMVLSVPEVR